MKPATFEYHAPATLAEAVDLLARHGDEGRALAGGQSLVPMLNLRLVRPAAIVDLNGVAGLDYHRSDPDHLVVGALCRHRDLELDREVMSRCDALAEAVPLIGHVAIRHRGTVAGSLAHADPASEWPCLALLLDAEIAVTGARGDRLLPARELFRGIFTTALEPGELIREVRFGWPPAGAGTAFHEVSRRHGDFALGAAAALVVLRADGTAREVRVAVAGIEGVPRRLEEVERALIGRAPTESACREAAAAARLEPTDDVQAPAAYRRHLAETLVRRALQAAGGRSTRREVA